MQEHASAGRRRLRRPTFLLREITADSPPTTATAYAYDAIAATEEERRAADEVAKQFRADQEKIFAQMRAGELDKKDIKNHPGG